MFIYSYQQHDHLLPGNDRMLVIGSSALAKNHGHLKSSRLAADTLIFNFPLNHPRLWRQMEHSLSGARYSIILFMWPPLHLSPANGRLMEKPPEGGGPMESAEDMLCRLFAFLRKQTRRLILLSSPPSDYGSARHPYAEEPGLLEAWNTLLRTLADRQNLPFIDFCGDMLQCRSLPGSGEEDFPEAYRNLGKQVLRRLPFGQTWVKRRSGKIHRLLEKRRKRWKERMLARWRTLAAPPHYREETDWITAIHSEKGQARILLIGDSVMRHLWRPLASELQEDIDLFSSTLIPGDPDYLPALAGYFPSAGYEAIIFSFGSHVTNKVSAISVDDFRKNYMAFVSQLSKRCRFLILATSTSIMDGPDGTLNEEKEKPLAAFNAIVREAASALPGAVLSDHHGFMQGARYIDPFHFSPPDRAYQAGKTAGLLLPLLQDPSHEISRCHDNPARSRIPVMFSATGSWGLPLGVAIHTLCLHASSGRFYDIHIVHDGMDARIIQELNQVAAPFPQVSLSFLQLPEEFRLLFQNGNKDRYSPLAYARLMAGSLFPQYGRIVYLDADVLLAGDVAELYFSDLRGASVAAAGDGLALWSIEKGTMHPHLEYMGNYLSSPLSYCNSGVLVLDLDQMRRRNLEHRLLQQLRNRPEPFPYPDQDILNIALHGDMTTLPPEWNFQFLSWTWDEEKTRLLRGTEFENVPSISCGRSWKQLHMVGPEKPWRLPDAPGTMGQFHWILYSFFWWPEAKRLPAFREELDAISQGLAPLLQRHIRGQQWKLFFSRGHIFRKRRDKIRWLKKLLSILDGRKP